MPILSGRTRRLLTVGIGDGDVQGGDAEVRPPRHHSSKSSLHREARQADTSLAHRHTYLLNLIHAFSHRRHTVLVVMSKPVPFFPPPNLPTDYVQPSSLPRVGQLVSATPYHIHTESMSCTLEAFPNVYGVYAKDGSAHYGKLNVSQQCKVLSIQQTAIPPHTFVLATLGNSSYDVRHGEGGASATRARLQAKLAARKAVK